MEDTAATAVEAPRNREQLQRMLEQLRADGTISQDEESTLIRHYAELQQEFDEQAAQMEPEYERRCEEDGKDAADRWLAEAARELGRRHGEATRRLTDQLRVVTG